MNLYYHVGLPKTATTSLQKNLFPYLFRDGFIHRSQSKKRNAMVQDLHRYYRSQRLERLLSSSLEVMESVRANSAVSDILVSDENITVSRSDIWNGKIQSADDFVVSCRALSDFFQEKGFHVKFLYFNRKLTHWLCSRYAESAKVNHHFSQSHFESIMRESSTVDLLKRSVVNHIRLRDSIEKAGLTERFLLADLSELTEKPLDFSRKLKTFFRFESANIDEMADMLKKKSNTLSVDKGIWGLKKSETEVDKGKSLVLTRELEFILNDITQRISDV